MIKTPRINAHGHLLPLPEEVPRFMKDKRLFWITEDKTFMCQNDWKRPVTHESFFVDKKIEWMKKNNIDHEVLITLSQLYANGLNRSDANDMIRFQNDFHSRIQSEYSQYFTGGFVVQPAFIDDALAEIERAVTKENLRILCLPTHYQDVQGQWKSTTHADTHPIWQLANEYKLAIQIHPYDAPKMIALEDKYWRFHLIWMCAQTADHYHMFSAQSMHWIYPDVNVCYAHGNQYGQVNVGRRRQGFLGRPDLFEGADDPTDAIGVKNIFFDTLVHDVDSFDLLIRRHGVSQVVAGLDDPYPLGEMDNVVGCYPGKVIDEGVETGVISKDERSQIWFENVNSWIGKEIGIHE